MASMKKNTCYVHSGKIHDPMTGGLNTPVFTSSSFEYLDANENLYPRYFNTPNQQAVIDKLCAIEQAEAGILFSSGMAAISTTMFALLGSGDHVLLQNDIYGGTHHFVTADFDRFGIDYAFIPNNCEGMEKALQDNTKLIYIETPSNPLLSITDIEAVVSLARKRQIISIIDNTFASPVNQNPIPMGVDIVVHSGTKYLGGHSDICCGAILTRQALAQKIRSTATNFGGSLNAETCYLLERSIKTLGLRVERQTSNAAIIARHLNDHPLVLKVHYPGLGDHPGHDIAKRQMSGYGAMLSFELAQEIDPQRFLKKLLIIAPAVSLGGVETIICSPAQTSHAKLSREARAQMGIGDNLLRLSVGIEDIDDLLNDLRSALSSAFP
jgi:cystathionine beta-lyase